MVDVVFDKLQGQVLQNRFKIEQYINKGEYGLVYAVADNQEPKKVDGCKHYVVKVCPKNQQFQNEIEAMKQIR